MPDPLYMPVLKGRQGEFAALAAIQPVTREHLLPLLEIVPGPADEPAAVKQMISRTAMKLRSWAGRRLLLDADYLATDVELHDGLGAVGLAVSDARDVGSTQCRSFVSMTRS